MAAAAGTPNQRGRAAPSPATCWASSLALAHARAFPSRRLTWSRVPVTAGLDHVCP